MYKYNIIKTELFGDSVEIEHIYDEVIIRFKRKRQAMGFYNIIADYDYFCSYELDTDYYAIHCSLKSFITLLAETVEWHRLNS